MQYDQDSHQNLAGSSVPHDTFLPKFVEVSVVFT